MESYIDVCTCLFAIVIMHVCLASYVTNKLAALPVEFPETIVQIEHNVEVGTRPIVHVL